MAGQKWIPVTWETCPGGISSAVAPELLPQGQFAWAANVAVRGGKPHTRPPIVERIILPEGLHQGSAYFGVQGGMIVCAIAGRIYRLRIGTNLFSYEEIPLGFVNSGVLKQAWFQQTVETLVIQDGQSNAILYNGSTARRAASDEVPRGRSMAYGNGRLWVAINENELVAGDIRTRTAGSELKFTETDYLSGGGALYFPRGITGLAFIPITGAADFGTLIVFSRDSAESIRADVTNRDMWPNMVGFVTNVFRNIGCSGDWSPTEVNQDLYWRDGRGDIRSLANAISTANTPGSTPISREVQRLVDFDSEQLLPWVSAVYFDNRLLMTSSPYLNVSAGVSFKDLVSLDFSPISTNQAKAPPAYDGQWTGIPGIAQLITGEFDGQNRAFAISSGEDGINRLWEIMTRGRDDAYLSCGSGGIPNRIEAYIEYPSIGFGLPKNRKRLERCDIWFGGIDGELDMRLYWRTDNDQKWNEWDDSSACATTTDSSTTTPHTWKNLLSQQRPQVKSFTIPDGIDDVTRYAEKVGFEFQIRLAWTGKCQIERLMIYATDLGDKPYADEPDTECVENDVTGNRLTYEIPVSVCPDPPPELPVFEQYDGPFEGVRYLTQEVEGDTRSLYSFSFLGMNHSHAAGALPLPNGTTTDGMILSDWSGSSTYDPNTDSYTGIITANISSQGAIPGGVNYIVPAGPPFTHTGEDFDEMLEYLIAFKGFSFSTRSYSEGPTADGTFVKRYFSETPGPAISGFFAGYTMSRIWSDGWTLTVTFSNLVTVADLGVPIARTGVPAQCQLVATYDPVTFTYTGTKSRVRQDVAIPAGRSKLYGDFVYLVTPEDGSPAYNYYDSAEYDVMGGTTYNAVTWFPWIVNATVCYVSGEFSFVPSYFLGYTTQGELELTELPASSTWPELVVYGMPPRNGEAWDSFQDYGGADTNVSDYLITLFTGYGWEEEWFFYGTDPIDVYDSFESYADGPLAQWTLGVGWASWGFFFQVSPWDVSDDFETYADGAITSWDVAGEFWAADGFFL